MPQHVADEALRRSAPAENAYSAIKAEYAAADGIRSNARYGYVHRATTS